MSEIHLIRRADGQSTTQTHSSTAPKSPNFIVGLITKGIKTWNANKLSYINDQQRIRRVELLYFPRHIFAVALCSELLMAEPELLKE